MASEQQTDTPTPAAPVGYESDGGDTQRSADETQYESDGGESVSMLVLHPPPLFRLFRRLASGSPPGSQAEQPYSRSCRATRCSLRRAVDPQTIRQNAVLPTGLWD